MILLKYLSKQIKEKWSIAILIVVGVIALCFVVLLHQAISLLYSSPLPVLGPTPTITPSPSLTDLAKFSSEEDFKAYLREAELGFRDVFGGGALARTMIEVEEALPAPTAVFEEKGEGEIPERVSETTVQVLGIDEPDIVKTDGKEIYFSSQSGYYGGVRGPIGEVMSLLPPEKVGETKIIKAFPPADLAIQAKIDKQGDLLLHNNILVVFSGEKIYGYNISDTKSPEKKWTIDLEENNYIAGARLYKDKIYLITRTRIDTYHPCPIRPLSIEGVPLNIKCQEIYHPTVNIPADVTYTALTIDPVSGQTEKTISFVGSSDSSIVYMSEQGIYVTYSYYEDFIKFIYPFYSEECQDIIPDYVTERLKKLMDYDISSEAKYTEFEIILESLMDSLSRDEEMKIENELTNRMEDYYKLHERELEKTGIAKIGLDQFNVSAVGNVPGKPLNQFSLDEYKGYFRVATTIGENRGIFGGLIESANDVYVLDKNLAIVGTVKDLGLGERIYSVRFLEDKGYVVTFKQIDPFFVLDLSDPRNPELKGELKIPGYSSYLHPITKDKILGMGKEGSEVKISLFDVQNPETPAEIAKYTLDEYWSDILSTHHAFLLDKKHQIFFLPGSKGGYVFSYERDKLQLKRAVSDIRARRAIYINDYLYIIGDDQITVLNEIDWEKVNELEL